jgi:hypothetical protein
MSRNDRTSNRRRTAAGVGVVTGAAFAAGFIGLGTAAVAGAADDGDGGAGAVTADQIAAVLKGDGVTNADFHDVGVTQVSQVLANNDNTDVFGDDVTGLEVKHALGANNIYLNNSSDLSYKDLANDLNQATPPGGGGEMPPGGGGEGTTADYTFPNGSPFTTIEDGTPVDQQGYSALFGAEDLNDAGAQSIGGHNAALDASLASSNPGLAGTFYTDVAEFEASNDHPFADLLNLFDPNAFVTQTFDDIAGTATDDGGYLVPTDAFGFFATGLDYALTGTGLTFLLNPAIDLFGAAFTDLGF